MSIFSLKRLTPTFVGKLSTVYLVPRDNSKFVDKCRRLESGLHLYNMFKERVLRVSKKYELNRVIYVPLKKIHIDVELDVVNPDKTCLLLMDRFRPMEEVIEERIDKLHNQLTREPEKHEGILGEKIKSELTRRAEDWGVRVPNVLIRFEDRKEDEDDENSMMTPPIYL